MWRSCESAAGRPQQLSLMRLHHSKTDAQLLARSAATSLELLLQQLIVWLWLLQTLLWLLRAPAVAVVVRRAVRSRD